MVSEPFQNRSENLGIIYFEDVGEPIEASLNMIMMDSSDDIQENTSFLEETQG